MSRGSLRKGFSLVELSIVLVILGLLTGGILAGQSLIRAAEVRNVSVELQRTYAAIQSFRDKYMALPGDMHNAVRFWGAQAGGTADGYDATCAALTTAATTTATCNGNGDGQIHATSGNWYERFRAWQHLANAGLMEGSYTGITTSGGVTASNVTPGINAPASRLSNVALYLGWWGVNTGASDGWFDGDYKGNCILMGRANNSYPTGNFLTPAELWNLDTKIDDGKPALGNLIVASPYESTNCLDSFTTEANTAPVTYRVTNSDIACSLIYRPGL